MKLPKIAIDNYQFVLVIVLMSVLTGTISYFTMPRSEDPVVKFPIFTILAVYPGTSPTDLEELIVDPIEDAVNEVEDIEEIRSQIQEGIVLIRVEATYGIEIDDKFDEVSTAINNIRSSLPQNLALFEVKKVSPLGVAILQLAVTSEDAPYSQLLKVSENLEDELKTVSGVRTVEVEAYPEEEVRVSLDFQKMAQQNIPLKQVIGLLQGNNTNIPAGDVEADSKSFVIKTSGGYKSLEEIRNTIISASGNEIVYLRDIATIDYDYADERFIARYQKKKAVYVTITQKEGFNILSLTENLRKKIEDFKKRLPEKVGVHYVFEQAPAVAGRINDFFTNLGQGVLLVGAIILLFLGFRSALIVMMVIPTSIIMAIGALDLGGYGLQQISIAGLVIALGLLVDNGIVVIENINRFLKEGYTLYEASYKGTSEVGWAIVSSTVTTLLSFFPLTQLNSGAGSFLKSLPMIVIYALIASLLLALTFTPLIASKSLISRRPKKKKNQTKAEAEVLTELKPTWVERQITSFIEKVYRPVLQFSLRYAVIVVIFSFMSFVGAMLLFPYVGVSLFPTADKPLLLIDINAPEGTGLKTTEKVALFVEKVLDKKSLIKDYTTNIGHGNPRVYYNRVPVSFKKNHAQMMVNLKEWERDSFYGLLAELRKEFDSYPGAKITISELKNGPPIEAPVAIRIVGDNFDTLKTYAKKVEKILDNSEGTLNVNNPSSFDKVDLKVKINKDKAGLIGIPIEDIDLTVRAALTGINASQINMNNGDKFDLVVRLPLDKGKPKIEDFDKIYLSTRSGEQVPLNQVAILEFESNNPEILHYNLLRNFTVTSDILDGYNINEVSQAIIKEVEKIQFPPGYSFKIAGEVEAQSDSFGGLGQILLVALIGIFAVLVLQFRSFTQPFIVFSAIPLAFVGSILSLYLTGWTFSFFAFVGFTSLVGIVINNSIILVDYTNQLLDRGILLKDAIQQACETRFIPIVLTTMTTIFGLLPLTLTNSGLWAPLGWTIIGGMISSTFLTLLIVPILYTWFTKPAENLKPVIKA